MAWYEPRRRIGVYYPAPLHWVLRVVREFGYRLRLAARAPSIERSDVLAMQSHERERQRLADEYASGYLAGWRECFHTCIEAVEEEIARADEAWDIGDLLAGPPKPARRN
jgi:hypothetical protein